MARTHAPGRPGITARLTTQPRVDPEIPYRPAGEIPNAGKERAVPRLFKTPRWSAVRRTGLRTTGACSDKERAMKDMRCYGAPLPLLRERKSKRRTESSGGNPLARRKRLG